MSSTCVTRQKARYNAPATGNTSKRRMAPPITRSSAHGPVRDHAQHELALVPALAHDVPALVVASPVLLQVLRWRLVGRIGVNHCLGDIHAMGAVPTSALALANIPYAHPRIVEDTLFHLMRGALDTLDEAGTELLGGHTAEAAELAFGLTVNGQVEPGNALLKSGLRAGQVLAAGPGLGAG